MKIISNTKESFLKKIKSYEINKKDDQYVILTETKSLFWDQTLSEKFYKVIKIEQGKEWGHWTRFFKPRYYVWVKFASSISDKDLNTSIVADPQKTNKIFTFLTNNKKSRQEIIEKLNL